jgi:ferrochelatase
MEARDLFIDAGGTRFDYIPALNANPLHAEMFADIVSQHLSGWVTADLTTLQFTATSPRD